MKYQLCTVFFFLINHSPLCYTGTVSVDKHGLVCHVIPDGGLFQSEWTPVVLLDHLSADCDKHTVPLMTVFRLGKAHDEITFPISASC